MPNAMRGQFKRVLIRLWIAFFLPGDTEQERKATKRKEKGRGEETAWQSEAQNPPSPQTPGLEGVTLCCPPAGAAHRGVLISPGLQSSGSASGGEHRVLLFSGVLVEGDIQPRTKPVSVSPVWTYILNSSSFHLWSLC